MTRQASDRSDGRVVNLLRIRPGRRLRLAPPWPCAELALLFDAASGDYWVLTPEGSTVVHALSLKGPCSMSSLLQRLPLAQADAQELLQELQRSGIIDAGSDASLALYAPATETLD